MDPQTIRGAVGHNEKPLKSGLLFADCPYDRGK
jgi:hypothetical protein